MINIKFLAIAMSATMPVCNVAGEPQFNDAGNALTITFHSPGTKKFQQAKHNFEKKKSNSVMALMSGKSDQARSWEDDARELAEFLADVTISLDNFDYEGRAPGKDTFMALYMDIEIGHIAESANKFLGDRGNFKKPAQNAS